MASDRATTNRGRSVELLTLHAVRETRAAVMKKSRDNDVRVMAEFSRGDLVLVAY